MKNGYKKISFLMSLLIACCISCGKGDKSSHETEEIFPITIGKSEVRDVIYRLHQVGTLEAKEAVMLKAETDGRVVNINFEEGGTVKSGQLLVKLDDSKIKTKIDQLQARLVQLKIQSDNSQRTLERKRPLLEEELVSRQDFDDLESKIKIERATIKEIEANLAHSRELFKDTEIRSPFSGVTSERMVSVGDFLKVGDPVVLVVQLNPLEISFRVDEKYKSRLYLKQAITITVSAYPERIFSGEVFFISPDIDINTRSFLVKGRVSNKKKLLSPGMFSEVIIVTKIHKNALTIPWESVIQLEDEVYLYKIDGQRVKKVSIKLGLVSEGAAEIWGDLKTGQEVVIEGKYALYEGARVQAKEMNETLGGYKAPHEKEGKGL